MGWYEEYKDSYGIGNLSQIRAELDVIFNSSDVDWDKEFVTVKVYKDARNATDRESVRYRGSKSFAASYMLLDGLCDEKFRELYNKTYNKSRISELAEIVQGLASSKGLPVSNMASESVVSSVMSRKTSIVRVYRRVYDVARSMAEDMEIQVRDLVSLLILGGSSYEEYKEIYDNAIERLSVAQILEYEGMLAIVSAYVNAKGSDILKERLMKILKVKEGELKKRWEIYNVDIVVIEMVRKVAKIEKRRVADIIRDAVVSRYGWIFLSHYDDEGDKS